MNQYGVGQGNDANYYREKYASQYIKQYGNQSTNQNANENTNRSQVEAQEATTAMPKEATALAAQGPRGAPWALVICAFAGASIPVAFAAAWRRRSRSEEEDSARVLFLA